MLNQVSWTTFFEIIIFLAALYYLYVLFRYYGEDLRHMMQPRAAGAGQGSIPEALRYAGPQEHSFPADPIRHGGEQRLPADEALEETAELRGLLKQCIQNASGKPFAPAVLIPQIKKLFAKDPALKHSPHRPAMNELVVRECERTGTALLTEDEVDQWWDDQ